MKTTLPSFAVAVGLGLSAFVGPALAGDSVVVPAAFQQDNGASERINFSGKLRMLSQRIPSAACHLAAGVDEEGAKKLLTGATAEFNKIINGLEFGDEALNMKGAEERPKTLYRIAKLVENWKPMSDAAEAMVAGDMSPANLQTILDQNTAVLDEAKKLVTEINSQYANPFEIVQADAMLVDVAGRQRMLTQKMSKESCMVSNKLGTADTAAALQETMQTFNMSLMALREGMPAVGIRRPPTAAIATGLQEVSKHWTGVKPALDAILAGAELDAAAQAGKFQALNATMAKMNEVVGMYSKATKKES
jgi:hypothetical protein